MFIILKISERDKSVTFRSHSKYYPPIYIFTQASAVILIICTYFTSEYAIFAMVLPFGFVIFLYIKLAPHGRFKSFINITGLYIQILPLLSLAAFIITKYLESAMMTTIVSFGILALFVVAIGLSIARLVLKYRDDKSRIKEQSVHAKVKLEEENLEAMTYSSIKKQLMNNSTDRNLNWEAINDSKIEKTPA